MKQKKNKRASFSTSNEKHSVAPQKQAPSLIGTPGQEKQTPNLSLSAVPAFSHRARKVPFLIAPAAKVCPEGEMQVLGKEVRGNLPPAALVQKSWSRTAPAPLLLGQAGPSSAPKKETGELGSPSPLISPASSNKTRQVPRGGGGEGSPREKRRADG